MEIDKTQKKDYNGCEDCAKGMLNLKKYYKTELHTHTTPVSGCSEISPKQLVEVYKENGYDSFVLTNHFRAGMNGDTPEEKVNFYLDDYYQCVEEGKRVGINVILGIEVRLNENKNEYLIYGICPEDLTEIYNKLDLSIDEFYRAVKNEKNVILQAHPFRNDMVLVNPESLDGAEAFNVHPNHNSRNGFAVKFTQENNLIATCGNDFHHMGQECLCATLTEEPIKDSYDLARILKSGAYVMSVGDFIISKS